MTSSTMDNSALELTATSIISAHPEQLSSELDGETILLQMSSGLYYGLNEMGAKIWEMIQTPMAFQALKEQLLEAYEVSEEVCVNEVTKLLTDLHNANLIEVKDS